MAIRQLVLGIILLFTINISYAFTMEEIITECGYMSDFVYKTAIERDDGIDKGLTQIKMEEYKNEGLISDQFYDQVLIIISYVYNNKQFTPDVLSFGWKSACLDSMLERSKTYE